MMVSAPATPTPQATCTMHAVSAAYADAKPQQEQHDPQDDYTKAACTTHILYDPADDGPQQQQEQVDPLGQHTFKPTVKLPSLPQWRQGHIKLKGARAPASDTSQHTVRQPLVAINNTGRAAAGALADCACSACHARAVLHSQPRRTSVQGGLLEGLPLQMLFLTALVPCCYRCWQCPYSKPFCLPGPPTPHARVGSPCSERRQSRNCQ